MDRHKFSLNMKISSKHDVKKNVIKKLLKRKKTNFSSIINYTTDVFLRNYKQN